MQCGIGSAWGSSGNGSTASAASTAAAASVGRAAGSRHGSAASTASTAAAASVGRATGSGHGSTATEGHAAGSGHGSTATEGHAAGSCPGSTALQRSAHRSADATLATAVVCGHHAARSIRVPAAGSIDHLLVAAAAVPSAREQPRFLLDDSSVKVLPSHHQPQDWDANIPTSHSMSGSPLPQHPTPGTQLQTRGTAPATQASPVTPGRYPVHTNASLPLPHSSRLFFTLPHLLHP